MKRIAIAAIALVAFAGTYSATAAQTPTTPTTTPRTPLARNCTASAFRPFSARVWRLSLWERGKPHPKAIRAKERRLDCAPPAHRRVMERRWERDRRRYGIHRSRKLAARARREAITPPGEATLASIRECESGGDYSTNTDNGFYGAYQFTISSWESVGGSGLPSEASPREQDERAAALYRRDGPAPWPVCGYR